MEDPFDAARAALVDTLEKSRSATQSYFDLVERTMRGVSNANGEKVGAFKAYVEGQVAANHAFVDRLLRTKDFQEAFRIQADYFQSQLKAAAEDANKLGAKMVGSFGQN